jgi:hypothetical protein
LPQWRLIRIGESQAHLRQGDFSGGAVRPIARGSSRRRASSHACHRFAQPYAGTPKYQQYAPTEATSARQINRPLGSKAADRIARKFGLNKQQAFTARQYALFVSGTGVGGNSADPRREDRCTSESTAR